jgi:hypothetical protein
MRECEDARMRAEVMTWNACAAVRVESPSLGSGVACLRRNSCDPFDQEILILRSTDVAEQGCFDVVAIEGRFVGLRSKSLDP